MIIVSVINEKIDNERIANNWTIIYVIFYID